MNTSRRTAARCTARRVALSLVCVLGTAAASSDPPVASPLGGGESISLEPAAPPANPRRHRAVFVCQQGGVPTFADRPCGPASAQRSLVVDAPRAGAATSTAPPAPRASTRPRGVAAGTAAGAADDTDSKCATLRRQLEELNDRMRAGYSAREAARLWQRWRDARERLRTSRC